MQSKKSPRGEPRINLPRRRFVQGLALGGAMAGLGIPPGKLLAATQAGRGPQVLSGRHFDLTYSATPVNFTGKARTATAINNSVPASVLRFKEGEEVTLKVTNRLSEDTSIHWHGLILPSSQDGVPGVSDGFEGIRPGETFTYRFPIVQNGTYWYHSHSGFQEQTGAYGAIIIDPKEPEPFDYDRDYVVLLSDWSDEDPARIYAKLKKMSHYYNFRERTVGQSMQGIQRQGFLGYLQQRAMWNQMRMSDTDISDVTGYTYTFLMNGQTPADGWLGLFKQGEKIRLRFINAGAMTFFDVRIPGMKMTVVAADGQYIQPVTVDEFRIGNAETYDVIVEPQEEKPYTIFAQAIDRSGYARGTLTPDASLRGRIPPMDEAPTLSHMDMGMGMDHGAHAGMQMNPSGAMDHSGHNMEGMAMNDNQSMDHSGHNMGGTAMNDNQSMSHSGHNMKNMAATGMTMKAEMGNGRAGFGSASAVHHPDSEFGPHVDMHADAPQYRLDDPGVGLRNNGRRVLTYADLRNLHPTADKREPSREITLHLTGNMSRYMWSFNGIPFEDADPIQLEYGERLRINLINDSMMNHPIHLHGLWSELETGDPDFIPRKHTIIVQPGARVSYLVTADAKGGWAYHCHLLYHMLGMFRKVVVS